jgi:hypothetical protein
MFLGNIAIRQIYVIFTFLGQNCSNTYITVIESRLNDLNYILNTHTNRKKRQICQVITQGFSKEYKLTSDASDVGVGAVLSQEGKDDIDLPNCYVS